MDRIPFARLASERKRMMRGLLARRLSDRALHDRAISVLRNRLSHWWGSALPALSQFAENPPTGQPPVPVWADPVELLVVRAIAATEGIACFGVEPGGAVFTEDSGAVGGEAFRVYITGLSPLLDAVGDIFNHVAGGVGGDFCERDGQFFTADGRKFVEVRPFRQPDSESPSVAASAPISGVSGWWKRLVDAVADWWNDDQPGRSDDGLRHFDHEPVETASSMCTNAPPTRDRIYQLVVDFDNGAWPASGVLSEMGYRVGKNGRTASDRRRILSDVYEVELVAASADSEDYIREWGRPKSAARLAKMKRCLSGFAAGARRRSADMSGAILDWEGDLEWLRQNFS
jgi:hypothetical protein